MLQRYVIARNDQTNRLKIREFAVLETKSHKRHDFKPTLEDYALIHEVSYNGDTIRTAIGDGRKALIAKLRSGDFFPIYPCVEIIAQSVTDLYNGNSEPSHEVFFDDRTILPTFNQG